MNRFLSATVVSYLVVSMAEGSLAFAQAQAPAPETAPAVRATGHRAAPLNSLRAASAKLATPPAPAPAKPVAPPKGAPAPALAPGKPGAAAAPVPG